MNTFAENLKHSLLSMIDEMEFYELDRFVHNPDKDFKRQRKFTFSSVMRFILSMGSASLGQELLKYFHCGFTEPFIFHNFSTPVSRYFLCKKTVAQKCYSPFFLYIYFAWPITVSRFNIPCRSSGSEIITLLSFPTFHYKTLVAS